MANNNSGGGIFKGIVLVCIGCVLIAMGLSFGGQMIKSSWWPFSGNRNFQFHWNDGTGEVIQNLPTVNGDIPETVRRIRVEVGATNVVIRGGAVYGYRLEHYPENRISVTVTGETISFRESDADGSFFFGKRGIDSLLEITVPSAFELDDCFVSLGAGTMKIEEISARQLRLETGAGSVRGRAVKADMAAIETGAGSAEFREADFRIAEIQTGAGKILLDGVIGERADIDTGTGAIELRLTGSEEDYFIEADRGLGSVRVGNSSWSGPGNSTIGQRTAPKKLWLSAGIGSVRVTFTD